MKSVIFVLIPQLLHVIMHAKILVEVHVMESMLFIIIIIIIILDELSNYGNRQWGTTDYTNYMGYGMDPQPCGNHFTDQQKMRMHCWICDALSSMVMSGCD